MAPLRAVLTLSCLTLATPACASHRPAPASIPTEWLLTVENHHWLDIEVHLVHGGQRTRVGVVTAATSQNFVLPTYLLGPGGDIELVASLIGGGQRVSTGLITLSGGQSVQWTLERVLSQSSFAVH